MNKIVEIIHGSHLYGLQREGSDTDYKGVFLPTIQDLAIKKVEESITISTNKTDGRNTVNDVDIQYFSLHKTFQNYN